MTEYIRRLQRYTSCCKCGGNVTISNVETHPAEHCGKVEGYCCGIEQVARYDLGQSQIEMQGVHERLLWTTRDEPSMLKVHEAVQHQIFCSKCCKRIDKYDIAFKATEFKISGSCCGQDRSVTVDLNSIVKQYFLKPELEVWCAKCKAPVAYTKLYDPVKMVYHFTATCTGYTDTKVVMSSDVEMNKKIWMFRS